MATFYPLDYFPPMSMQSRKFHLLSYLGAVAFSLISLWLLKIFIVLSLVIISLEDITKRKELEIERNKLFELPDPLLCALDAQGRFKRVNKRFSKVLGHEAHGGKIWVESELGAGSIFYVDWPLLVPEKRHKARGELAI